MVINISVAMYRPFDIGISVICRIACARVLSGFIFPTDAL